jgi:hypothetical protein
MALTAKQKREAREQSLRDEGAAAAIANLNKESTIHPDKVASSTGQVAKPQSAGAKVIVACKLGVAYYDIQLCRIDEKFEQNMQGGRTVKEATRIGSVVRLRGTAYPRGTPPAGFPDRPEIVNGAALTRGIDKEWFDVWMEQHKLDPLVMNKMIFAAETDDAIRGESAELSKFLSGLEPVNPKGDPRIPKSSRPSEITDIEAGQRPGPG